MVLWYFKNGFSTPEKLFSGCSFNTDKMSVKFPVRMSGTYFNYVCFQTDKTIQRKYIKRFLSFSKFIIRVIFTSRVEYVWMEVIFASLFTHHFGRSYLQYIDFYLLTVSSNIILFV